MYDCPLANSSRCNNECSYGEALVDYGIAEGLLSLLSTPLL